MNDAPFDIGKDYDVPLLRLLCKLPGGQGETAEVCRLFEVEYRDGIPEDHRVLRSNGEPIWYNNVCWSRARLKESGFLDMPRRGIWRVTEAGQKWAEENPKAVRLSRVRTHSSGKLHQKRSPKVAPAAGLTLEMLEQTRQVMPADQFRQVWGALYDQLLAEERTKAVTQITQTELGRRTRRWLDDVHAFLSGKNATQPSSEVICDWIQFCYVLELYHEAAALLPYVREDEVDAASYRRAKRVAEVCRSKLAG
jgi:hypothetical protein